MRALAVLLAATTLMACASTPDSSVLPPDEQFARAESRFAARDFRQAIADYQTFAFNYPQDPRVADARWKTAEGYHALEDWATAAQEYLNFQRDFPREGRGDDALYQAGRAFQKMSLRPELDQRDTERAINVYARLVSEYPGSDYVEQAREHRQRLRNKLGEKAYLVAEFYFDEEEYEAAEIYLTDLIAQHSDTAWLPAGYALLARTFCAQGLDQRASEVFARLADVYPDSNAARRARDELEESCRRVETPDGG